MENRELGFYWVSETPDVWVVAKWRKEPFGQRIVWKITNSTDDYADDDFLAIDETRIEKPQQLQKDCTMTEQTAISTQCHVLPAPFGPVEYPQKVTFTTEPNISFVEMVLTSEDKGIDAPNLKINFRKSELIKILKFLTE